MNREIVLEIMKLVVMLVSVLVTSYVIPWIKANTDSKKLDTVLGWVEYSVHAAEQIYGADSGEQKKEYVMHFLEDIMAAKKVNIKEEEIEMLVEAAVGIMNSKDFITVRPDDYEAIVENAE